MPEVLEEPGANAYLTRPQLVRFLRQAGYPITLSTITKLCAPSRDEGPPMIGLWAKRALYDRDQALAWARGRMRSAAGKT
jgi:hypothetical protein